MPTEGADSISTSKDITLGLLAAEKTHIFDIGVPEITQNNDAICFVYLLFSKVNVYLKECREFVGSLLLHCVVLLIFLQMIK